MPRVLCNAGLLTESQEHEMALHDVQQRNTEKTCAEELIVRKRPPKDQSAGEAFNTARILSAALGGIDLALDFVLGDMGMGTLMSLLASEALKHFGASRLLLGAAGIDCESMAQDWTLWEQRRQKGKEVNLILRMKRLSRANAISLLRQLEESGKEDLLEKILVPGYKTTPEPEYAVSAQWDEKSQAIAAADS